MPPRKPPAAPTVLTLYTIYSSPVGYKGRFVVVRRHVSERDNPTYTAAFTDVAGDYATLDEARVSLPPWLTNVGRLPDDDESIVETWL